MKKLNVSDRKLCAIQARFFEHSIDAETCSSPVFIRRFMNSQLARRMDKGSFLFESSTEESMFDEIRNQYGKSSYGKTKFTRNQLHWMGYTYRYWCCLFELNSQRVFQICGSREMARLYEPYHTLDPQQAIERILEAKGIKFNQTSIERGVETLRRIRSEERYDYYLTGFKS